MRESQLQEFFERNDSFFRVMGYKNVYSQIVLERDDGSKLIPDFVLEPFDGEWCDILELKLPKPALLVGGRDRKDFSQAVHQLHAQLREYSSYFDEDKYYNRIKEKYGLKLHRPKLIGVIGQHYEPGDEKQIRRVMTQYPNFDVVPFNKLIQFAKRHILL